MKSATAEPLTVPNASTPRVQARRSRDDQEAPGRIPWAMRYAALLTSVGLCVGGYFLDAAIGHPSLIQSAVALAILGLLAAWVRTSRAASSVERTEAPMSSRAPFTIIHVGFPPASDGPRQRRRTAPPETESHLTAVRSTAQASHR
jgi:hypothetical protein